MPKRIIIVNASSLRSRDLLNCPTCIPVSTLLFYAFCAGLLAIRTARKTLNDRVGIATGAYGAQILAEIAASAVATVFKIHRALRSTERSENTVTSLAAAADLSDVLHRALRLFALCKVSGDVTREVGIRVCEHAVYGRIGIYVYVRVQGVSRTSDVWHENYYVLFCLTVLFFYFFFILFSELEFEILK